MSLGQTTPGAGQLVPFIYVSFDPSQAAGTQPDFRTLIIAPAHAVPAGHVSAITAISSPAAASAEATFGKGSTVLRMAERYRAQDPIGGLSAIGVGDTTGAIARIAKFTVTAAAAKAGTIALYIGGRRVTVAVAAAATADTIAASIASAITDAAGMPFTAAAAAGVVTLTAREKGAFANDIDIRDSYYAGEALPSGVTINYTAPASTAGAGDLDFDGTNSALDAIGEERFDLIVTPWLAAADITELKTWLYSRWGPLLQVDGVALQAVPKTYESFSALSTWAKGATKLNNAAMLVIDRSTSPMPPDEWAAALAGAVAPAALEDPARPFQTLPLLGVLPAAAEDRRIVSESQALLKAGIATHSVDGAGTVRIQRLVTTYVENGGAPDIAYRDLNTVLTLAYLRRDFRETFRRKFPRHKLAGDGTRVRDGQPVMTPRLGRTEAIARFGDWEDRGLVEDAAAFKKALVVQRNADDPDRLDFLLPPNLVNQLRIVGATVQFRL